MGFKDNYDFENLVNESERLVIEELGNQLETSEYDNICKCQDCILDMAAYALNSIKPMYRVSLLGTLYAHNIHGTDYENKIKEAVDQAIRKISKNPSHS